MWTEKTFPEIVAHAKAREMVMSSGDIEDMGVEGIPSTWPHYEDNPTDYVKFSDGTVVAARIHRGWVGTDATPGMSDEQKFFIWTP